MKCDFPIACPVALLWTSGRYRQDGTRRVSWASDRRCTSSLPRRSTLEVHPISSEAPHVWSSIPHPEADICTTSSCIPMHKAMTQVRKTPFFETRLAFQPFWVKEPRHSENILAEMCYLYGRTRLPRYSHYPRVTRWPIFQQQLLLRVRRGGGGGGGGVGNSLRRITRHAVLNHIVASH